MIDSKFTLFDRASSDNIRVGYVDPKRGYIDNVTIEEANKYAKKNPGTVFILKTRDKTKYLTINKVNKLTTEDVKTKKKCKGVKGINKNDKKSVPKVNISGCGGVGAAANIVISPEDNSVLSVEVISHGFGYTCEPKVTIEDDGTRLMPKFLSRIGPVETEAISFGDFDFEDYKIPVEDNTLSSDYDENGYEIGDWDPDAYLTDTNIPNFTEIQMYQRYMKNLTNPWWSTRTRSFAQTSSKINFNRLKYDVEHWKWGEKIYDTDFVFTEFDVFSSGSIKNRRIEVEFVAQDDSGHKFTLKGINQNFTQTFRKKVKLNTTYKVTPKGLKGTAKEKIEQQLLKERSFGKDGVEKVLDREGSYTDLTDAAKSKAAFFDIIGSANDNDDLQIFSRRGEFRGTKLLKGDPLKDQARNSHSLTFRIDKDPKPRESFMNKYAISPVPASDSPGSDYSNIQYIMKWDINFPITGDYVFKGQADTGGQLLIDGETIDDLPGITNKEKPGKWTRKIERGVHEVRLDVLNEPKIKTRDLKQIYSNGGRGGCPTEIDFKVTTDSDFASGIKIPDLNIDFTKDRGGEQLNKSFSRTVEHGKEYDVTCTSSSPGGGGKSNEYKIRVADPGSLGRGPTAQVKSVSNKTIKFTDAAYQMDTDAQFKILSTSPGVSARFSGSNDKDLKLIVKGEGDVTLQLKWDENPNKNGEAVGNIKVGGEVWKQTAHKDRKDDVTKTIKVSGGDSSRKKANIKLKTAGENVLQMEDNGDDDQSVLVCTVSCGRFININGNRCKLIFDAPEKRDKSVVSIFNTKDSIKDANQKLWRTDGESGEGDLSDFFNRYGVRPYRKVATVENRNKVTAKFDKDGSDLFLKLNGVGEVEIDFLMDVNDNLTDSGLAASEIRIETDTQPLILKRDVTLNSTSRALPPDGRFGRGNGRGSNRSSYYTGKEKEKVKGKGEFTGGKKYKVKIIGGSSDSGFKTIDKTTVGFDDNISNGFDENIGLKIKKIKQLTVKEDVLDLSEISEAYEVVWDNVVFPVDGEYEIDYAARDNLLLTIREAGQLGPVYQEKTLAYVYHDFKAMDKGTKVEKFTAGTYRIAAMVQQKKIKEVKKGKLLSFGLNIKTKGEVSFELDQSWQENPLGVALTIKAPKPPKLELEDGRKWEKDQCPPNPLWSTRFKTNNSKKSWWPVIDPNNKWGRFMEQYAISPVEPSAIKGTATGLDYYKNTWDLEILHDGTYGLKGACDKHGQVSIHKKDDEGNSSMVAIIHTNKYELSSEVKKNLKEKNIGKLRPAKFTNPEFLTFELKKGKYKVEAEVKNSNTDILKNINKKVFHTADWVYTTKKPPRFVEVYFTVEGQGTIGHRAIKFEFTEKIGKKYTYDPHTFTIRNPKTGNVKEKIAVRLKPNTDYDVKAVPMDVTPLQKFRRFTIQTMGSPTSAIKDVSKKRIKYTDSVSQDDTDAEFLIKSTSPGIKAEFSPSGRELIVHGRGNGTVDLELKWSDDVYKNGQAVGQLTVGDLVFKQRGKKGDKEKTLKVDAIGLAKNEKNSGILEQGTIVKNREGKVEDISNEIFADYYKSANDDDDIRVKAADGLFTPSNQRRLSKDSDKFVKKYGEGVRGRGTYDLTYRFELDDQSDYIKSVGDARFMSEYDGQDIEVTAYSRLAKKGDIGLRMTPVFYHSKHIMGKTWKLRWEDVDFPEAGIYRIQLEGDDEAKLFIDGEKICKATKDDGVVEDFIEVKSPGKRIIEIELQNRRMGTDKVRYTKYKVNPTFVAAKITTPVEIDTGKDETWVDNPIGISAVLVPPPCIVKEPGDGGLTDIILLEEGGNINGGGDPPPFEEPEPGEPEGPEPGDDDDGDGGGEGSDTGDDTGGGDDGDDNDPGGGDPGEPNYPVLAKLKEVIVGDPGINYDCAGDPIVITPDNGAKLEYECDPFGKIRKVNVIDPGGPVTKRPTIMINSETGVNARFIPVIDVIRDPITDDPSKLITVTDLVGVKKTGYYKGRPYYGSVYYEDGIKYAGYYETPGDPVQIYDTLEESITGVVKKDSSGTIRLGTDTLDNQTGLDIPGTPDYLA